MGTVRQERTNYRGNDYSQRHRLFGFDCPAMDIDMTVGIYYTCKETWLEYDHHEPVALFEIKERTGPSGSLGGYIWEGAPQIRVLIKLGDRADLPVFGVEYYLATGSYAAPYEGPLHYYKITALCPLAKDIFARHNHQNPVLCSEASYCRFLYLLRGRKPPGDVLANLCKVTPPVGFLPERSPSDSHYSRRK